ncbi:hypothetical protein [Brevibacillus invocatus]|uniref:Uncharacterized protein n=1 Tax=Brevibacillus invocatus TaxID=173959 RepID=A0A3M8BNQ3_9BACL|nr:hypothetical protein [Brevibacillus invocatus]MCM3082151.1 outer membrane lipoprotein-sorting protein [Brevibacillus invocatus]MCM3432575.1 outer membrane lipoprotein-sorting protein [Brevibacillus invocatus]RNB65036.1 hypothetical protein EDM52_23875 [Brevibacillus invocatus]
MKKLTFALFVALAVTLGWSGASAPIFAETVAPTQVVQKQGTIEHMKTVRVDVDGNSVTIFDTWFNLTTGQERYDDFYYYSTTKEMNGRTSMSTAYSSLFERTAKQYENKSVWKSIGTVEVNGIQVELLKGNGEPKGDPVYYLAYIDRSTGLPLKEEAYNSSNEVMTAYFYFFDHVHDLTGEIFKQTK